jgi:hypothetical protein
MVMTTPVEATVPINPLCQPWASKKTPRNRPIPDRMSAMKKFSESSGNIPRRAGLPCFVGHISLRRSPSEL